MIRFICFISIMKEFSYRIDCNHLVINNKVESNFSQAIQIISCNNNRGSTHVGNYIEVEGPWRNIQ